ARAKTPRRQEKKTRTEENRGNREGKNSYSILCCLCFLLFIFSSSRLCGLARDLKPLPLQRRKQLIQAVLGVAEQHHAFLVVIQLIIHSGEARPHTTFEDHNRFGPVHLQDGHAVKRTVAVVLGG